MVKIVMKVKKVKKVATRKPCRTSARASPKCKTSGDQSNQGGRRQDRVAATTRTMSTSRMTRISTTATMSKTDEAHRFGGSAVERATSLTSTCPTRTACPLAPARTSKVMTSAAVPTTYRCQHKSLHSRTEAATDAN